MKNRFPFRIGTTSYILPDHILPNVRYLKDKVDMVELLLFEIDEQSNHLTPDDVKELNDIAQEHDLVYTVHLPINIHLGTRNEKMRRLNVDTQLRAIDETRELILHAWDLHLEPDEPSQTRPIHDIPAWQAACHQSLEDLKRGGADIARTGVETLEYYPFELAKPVVDACGFGYCVDIGHCWYRGYDEDWFIKTLLPKARSFHMHGCDELRDHRGLDCVPPEKLNRFLQAVASQPDAADRTVSIEIFEEKYFTPSMEVLNEFT